MLISKSLGLAYVLHHLLDVEPQQQQDITNPKKVPSDRRAKK